MRATTQPPKTGLAEIRALRGKTILAFMSARSASSRILSLGVRIGSFLGRGDDEQGFKKVIGSLLTSGVTTAFCLSSFCPSLCHDAEDYWPQEYISVGFRGGVMRRVQYLFLSTQKPQLQEMSCDQGDHGGEQGQDLLAGDLFFVFVVVGTGSFRDRGMDTLCIS